MRMMTTIFSLANFLLPFNQTSGANSLSNSSKNLLVALTIKSVALRGD